jgi:hypothetical protein
MEKFQVVKGGGSVLLLGRSCRMIFFSSGLFDAYAVPKICFIQLYQGFGVLETLAEN